MATSTVSTRIASSFDDPSVAPAQWADCLRRGGTDTIFLTWEWQRTWWSVFGRGDLTIAVAEQDGAPVAIAPLFCDGDMLFFVGSGGSDYLDFVGDTSDVAVLSALLESARDTVENFVGFRFYHVPDASPTAKRLVAAAELLGLQMFDEGQLPAPRLSIRTDPDAANRATQKQSLLRHERYFSMHGTLSVTHTSRAEEIAPALDAFFQQHIDRWSGTQSPSLFFDHPWRQFYRLLLENMADRGWLRFTRVDWNGEPIASHFGFCYGGEYLWYKPAFEIRFARRSPGEVLLRQLLLAAIQEGADVFDFGLGDEPFKQRFATHVRQVRTWGLYPKQTAR